MCPIPTLGERIIVISTDCATTVGSEERGVGGRGDAVFGSCAVVVEMVSP